MTPADILPRLQAWATHQRSLRQQYEAFCELTGGGCESPLWLAVFAVSQAYTDAVSEAVGDVNQWLSWWQYECDLGDKPMECTLPSGESRLVRTVEDLAWVVAK